MLLFLAMITLFIATRNRHKVGEIRSILGARFRYLTLDDLPWAPKIIEDAPTFAGNATLKSVGLAKAICHQQDSSLLSKGEATGQTSAQPDEALVLADDSGLEVDALHGAPGVLSARFAAVDSATAGNSTDAANNAKLLGLLAGLPDAKRSARFRCVLALTPVLVRTPENSSPSCSADEFELRTELFNGVCEGRIGFEPHGKGGFGYDPLFVPHGFSESFAELGEETKNRLSHRARALEKLRKRFENNLS